MLVDLTSWNLTGKAAEAALGRAGITVNKNAVPFDRHGPFITSGVRIGTPFVTSRGLGVEEMKQVGAMIVEVLKQPDDDNLLDRIRINVKALCSAHPIHDGLDS